MSEPAYVHIVELDDPAKPYRRVYACTAHTPLIHVKTHAARRDVGFGRLKWDITGSLCDSLGAALRDERGEPLIHTEAHGLSVQTDAGIRRSSAEELLRALIEADGDAQAVERLRHRAVLLFAEAPTRENVEARIVEDFERELLFIVAKVERAELARRVGVNLGGVKSTA